LFFWGWFFFIFKKIIKKKKKKKKKKLLAHIYSIRLLQIVTYKHIIHNIIPSSFEILYYD